MVGDASVLQPRDDDRRDLNELFLLSVEDDPGEKDESCVGDVTSCGSRPRFSGGLRAPMAPTVGAHCACSNSSAGTGSLSPHTKFISKNTFPPLSNSTDDRIMITDHSLTDWCGQFFHKVFPTKEIWMVTRTCRLDFRPRQVSYIL